MTERCGSSDTQKRARRAAEQEPTGPSASVPSAPPDRFRSFISDALDVAYWMSPDWSEMHRLDGHDFLTDTCAPSRSWLEAYIPADERPHVLDAIERAIESKTVFDLEHRVILANGTIGWTHSRAVPMLDDQGEIVEWVGAAWDITDRKQSERWLRESEAKYRSLFESMNEGFALCELMRNQDGEAVDFRYLEVNPAFASHTGIPAAEIPGRTLTELFPEPYAEWLAFYADVVDSGVARHVERLFEPLGRWFSVWGYPRGGERFAALCEDVTERVVTEQALRESEAKANELIKYAPTGIYEVGFDPPQFLRVNDAMCEMSGYSREELLAMNPFQLLGPESARRFRDRVAEALAGGSVRRDVEYRVFRKDGAEIIVVLKVRFIFDGDGVARRAFVIGHDVTERVMAERERQRLLDAEHRASALASALNSINEILLSAMTTDELLGRIVAGTSEAIGADRALIADANHGELRIRHVCGHGLSQELVGTTFPLADSPAVRRALREQHPALVGAAADNPEVNRKFAQEAGNASFITIPLVLGGVSIGFLSYAWDSPQHFDENDEKFARRLMTAMSLALESARHFEVEHDIAERLQDALLTLPQSLRGVEFAHAYHSATEAARVGGDFYDLFQLGHDHIGIAIGDVAGKGLDASVLTSMVKNTLRAHANEKGKTPAQILSLTNDVVFQSTAAEAFATVFFAILDRLSGKLVYANAGHTTTALARADGSIARLSATGPLLGGFAEPVYEQAEARLARGDLLFLYTDGVTESRRDDVFYGEDRLFDLLASRRWESAQEAVSGVVEDVTSYSGNRLRDDLAILAVRRPVEEA
jgi:PAS domain S-box-containing protein